MSMREALMMTLIAVIGLTSVVWFLSTHEQVTEQQWTGFRGEAKRNPWLAAQRFLSRVDMPAAELRTLPDLRSLPTRATLIVPKAHHTISGPLRDEIVTWVGRGGYLIIETENPAQSDPLVEAFGVRRAAIRFDEFDEEPEDSDEPQFTAITLPNANIPALLDQQGSVSLDADDAWFRAESKYGTFLLALRVGEGIVTVTNDLDYFSNRAIGSLDHAQFLLDLVRLRNVAATGNPIQSDDMDAGARKPDRVLFFNRPAKLSLIDWLKKHAWAPLAGGGAALLFWLWRAVPRFGPIMPDPDRTRRRLLDHLRASGRFLWSNGHATRLLEASREACLRRLARSLPHFRSATAQARSEQLVHTLGITQEQAQRILQPQQGGKMIHFWHTVRLYQRVCSRLAVHSATSSAKPN